jgi:glucose/arabinose dehydrogenase
MRRPAAADRAAPEPHRTARGARRPAHPPLHARPRLLPGRAAALAGALAAALASALAPAPAAARGYVPKGDCGGYARVDVRSPAGTCVALVADEAEGLRAPRRILEVAPGRYWIVDMGSWEPRQGRLLEMTLPEGGPAPRRAALRVLAERLDRPLGLVLGPDGKAYIGEAGSVWRTPVPPAGQPLPPRETVVEGLPADGAHPLTELAFAPDGRLFLNAGSATDACRGADQAQPLPCPELAGAKPRAAVYEATLGGPQRTLQQLRPFATGLRNSVALAVLPDGLARGAVLQAENSIDYQDIGQPAEELNVLQAGKHYGWPYCVADRQPARGYEQRYDCARSAAPLMLLPAHAAPLQLLPGPAGSPFAGQVLAAWHGYKPAGHRVVGHALDAKTGLPAGAPKEWLAGWDARPGVRPRGTPTGLAVDRQGRLLVVEDFNRTVLMLLPAAGASAAGAARTSATAGPPPSASAGLPVPAGTAIASRP